MLRELIEAIVTIGTLVLAVETFTPIETSLEGISLVSCGWWVVIRGLIRPPVSVEIVPALGLTSESPIDGGDIILVNRVKRTLHIGAQVIGRERDSEGAPVTKEVKKQLVDISLAPSQRLMIGPLVAGWDFSGETVVLMKWRDWRRRLGWVTERRTTVYTGGIERPLSLDNRGIYTELKRMADGLLGVNWKGHAYKENGRAHFLLIEGDDQGFTEKLRKSKGLCRVVYHEHGHEFFNRTPALDSGSPMTQAAQLSQMKGSFTLEFVNQETTPKSPNTSTQI